MSRIFEALQKSESVRGNGNGNASQNFATSPLAEEILQSAEKDVKDLAPLQSSVLQALPLSLPAESHLVAITQRDSLASEKFRYLAVKLRQLQAARGIKTILISSTLPEEGKSMVSANLAVTLARRQQQKVLLIEGDLRRPVQAQRLGHIWLEGLAEWLAEPPIGLPNLYQLEGTGVCLLPAGSPPENPLELMQPDRLQILLGRLAQQFDWIILDSPPLLPLADTTVWAKLADGMILVVREGKSEKKYLQRGLAAVPASSLLAVVVNSCSNTDNKNYYSRYSATAGPVIE